MPIIRVKARQKGVTGYINCMRGTWLGNPFPLNKYSKEDSKQLYQIYLQWRISRDNIFRVYLMDLGFRSLKGDEILLGCTCNLDHTMIETMADLLL
jgi:hypothetical protein